MTITDVLVAFRANLIPDMNCPGSNKWEQTSLVPVCDISFIRLKSTDLASLLSWKDESRKVETKSTAPPEIDTEEFKSGLSFFSKCPPYVKNGQNVKINFF